MKSDAVDAWLKHWLKLQRKDKRPLELKGPADKSPELRPKRKNLAKRKAGKGKARYIDSEDSVNEESADTPDNRRTNKGTTSSVRQIVQDDQGDQDDKILPPSPLSASNNRKTRRAFLESLSNDENYKRLLLLLRAAKVSKID